MLFLHFLAGFTIPLEVPISFVTIHGLLVFTRVKVAHFTPFSC